MAVEWKRKVPLMFRRGQYLHVERLQGLRGLLVSGVIGAWGMDSFIVKRDRQWGHRDRQWGPLTSVII